MFFSDICIILNPIKYMDFLKKNNEPLNVININIQSLNLKIATAYAYSYISKIDLHYTISNLPLPYKKLFWKISSTHWKTLNIIVWIFWITSASYMYRQLPTVFYVDVNWIITWDQHKCFDLITQTLYTHFKNCSTVLFKYLLISTGKSV